MQQIRLILLNAIVLVFCLSCGSDDDGAKEVAAETEKPNPIASKTTTYEQDVAPIMSTNCVGCHASPPTNGAPMSLLTFADVVDSQKNRNLFGRMSSTNTGNVMPPSGRLSSEILLAIEDWIADGLLEK